MSNALKTPVMTQEEFLDWAVRQDGRYEFDGVAPVSMVEAPSATHGFPGNIWRAVDRQIAGTGCEAFIQDGGVATIGNALRFPDVTVICSPVGNLERILPSPVVVFEVISPSTERNDKIFKLEEYRAVRSITTFVVVEQAYAGLTVSVAGDRPMGCSGAYRRSDLAHRCASPDHPCR